MDIELLKIDHAHANKSLVEAGAIHSSIKRLPCIRPYINSTIDYNDMKITQFLYVYQQPLSLLAINSAQKESVVRY